MDNLYTQIVEHVASYLDNRISLNEFQAWFVPAAWDVEAGTCEEVTFDLIRTIELYLAEYSSSHRTEDELRNLFKEAVAIRGQFCGEIVPVYRAGNFYQRDKRF
ncbi:MAG TPA: hypothetical protein VKX17_20215 [Planctomycetota bacterium]|nr:hypothetical protein [Planctomycetota bacterium]